MKKFTRDYKKTNRKVKKGYFSNIQGRLLPAYVYKRHVLGASREASANDQVCYARGRYMFQNEAHISTSCISMNPIGDLMFLF